MVRKQEMDEDIFDQMVEALHQPTIQEPPMPTSTRWQPDGTYDKKPNDPNYFSKYYQKKLSTPFTCPDCGRTISSKSIYQTSSNQHLYEEKMPVLKSNFFFNNNHFYWEGFMLKSNPQSQKFQQATHTQKLLKEMPPYRV